MKCADARKSLVAYLEEDLSPPRAKELEAHLVECKGCRSELKALKATLNLLREEAPPEASKEFLANLLPRVRMRLEERKRVRTQLLPRFAYPSAAVLTVLAVLLLVRLNIRPERVSTFIGDGVESLLQELVSAIDIEALESSLLTHEASSVLLTLPEYSEGVGELLAEHLSATDLERIEETLEEGSDLPLSASVEDLSESEMEELAASMEARWGRP